MSARSRSRTANCQLLACATALALSAAAGCAERVPRLPQAGDRVRAWTAADTTKQEAIVGEVVSLSADSVRIETEGRRRIMPWKVIQALEIDVSRERDILRVLACGLAAGYGYLFAEQITEDDLDEGQLFISAGFGTLYAIECIAPRAVWRTARVPSGGEEGRR